MYAIILPSGDHFCATTVAPFGVSIVFSAPVRGYHHQADLIARGEVARPQCLVSTWRPPRSTCSLPRCRMSLRLLLIARMNTSDPGSPT